MRFGRIAVATLVAGLLDIGIVFLFAANIGGSSPARVLAGVASGPFGAEFAATDWAPAVGLAVHFAIMTAMVAAFAMVAHRHPTPLLRLGPVATGILYGLGLYLIMYWVVLPLRWPDVHPQTEFWRVTRAIFAHVAMVGLPIAFILWPRREPDPVAMPVAAAP